MQTLLEYFATAASTSPDRPLFVYRDGSITYRNAASRILRGVDQLKAAGLNPRSKVLCLAEDTIPLALFILTAGYSQIIPIAISPLFSTQFLHAMARQSGARAVFSSPAFLERASELGLPVLCYEGDGPGGLSRPTVRGGSHHGIFPEAHGNLPNASTSLQALAEKVNGENICMLQPTAGSTGTPKLVMRTFDAFSRYAHFVGDQAMNVVRDGEQPRMLGICALTHAFAGHMFTMGMRLGAAIMVPQKIDMLASLSEIRTLDPSILPMTPRVLDAFIRQSNAAARTSDGEQRMFGPAARLLISAGGKGNISYFQRLLREELEVIEVYGSSEASVIAVSPYGKWHAGRSGVVVDDVEMKIANDHEIHVRSPGLMLGYHGQADLTELVFNDGYYKTGDLGRIDEDGYLEILGRKRDVFSTPEGSNIYAERIEIQLESVEDVEQAIIAGDGKHYLTAHLVLRQPVTIGLNDDALADVDPMDFETDTQHFRVVEGLDPSGYIDPVEFAKIYDRMGAALLELNSKLEVVEQIVAFALYARPFPTHVYRIVSGAKVGRDRAAFVLEYDEFVDQLYSRELVQDSPALVPPKERRFRDRTTKSTSGSR